MSIFNKDYIYHLYFNFKLYTQIGPRKINKNYNLLIKII